MVTPSGRCIVMTCPTILTHSLTYPPKCLPSLSNPFTHPSILTLTSLLTHLPTHPDFHSLTPAFPLDLILILSRSLTPIISRRSTDRQTETCMPVCTHCGIDFLLPLCYQGLYAQYEYWQLKADDRCRFWGFGHVIASYMRMKSQIWSPWQHGPTFPVQNHAEKCWNGDSNERGGYIGICVPRKSMHSNWIFCLHFVYGRVKCTSSISAGVVGFYSRKCWKQCNSYCELVRAGTIVPSINLLKKDYRDCDPCSWMCSPNILLYTTANDPGWWNIWSNARENVPSVVYIHSRDHAHA